MNLEKNEPASAKGRLICSQCTASTCEKKIYQSRLKINIKSKSKGFFFMCALIIIIIIIYLPLLN